LIDSQAQKRVFAEFEEEVRAIEESYEQVRNSMPSEFDSLQE
jgi:hypothetical protein